MLDLVMKKGKSKRTGHQADDFCIRERSFWLLSCVFNRQRTCRWANGTASKAPCWSCSFSPSATASHNVFAPRDSLVRSGVPDLRCKHILNSENERLYIDLHGGLGPVYQIYCYRPAYLTDLLSWSSGQGCSRAYLILWFVFDAVKMSDKLPLTVFKSEKRMLYRERYETHGRNWLDRLADPLAENVVSKQSHSNIEMFYWCMCSHKYQKCNSYDKHSQKSNVCVHHWWCIKVFWS